MREVKINVKHVTRVEGHGNIKLNSKDGRIEELVWNVDEAPRFFEAMVRGRSYEDIQTIVSRICGICSITHSLAGTKAVERAMGINVSPKSDALRMLMHYSEQLQSHILHIGYLAAPDFFMQNSVVPLLDVDAEAVKTVIRIHRTANDWSNMLAGRQTHPVTIIPGGLTKYPSAEQLAELKSWLERALCDLDAVADVIMGVRDRLPDFERDTEYVSLKEDGEYTFYHGDICSTDQDATVEIDDWEKVSNEYVVDQSTAKWAKWHRESYAVGALARFNNNAELLTDKAKKAAERFGLNKGCCNPFMNTVVQLVECFHVAERSIQMIEELLAEDLKYERPMVKPKAGKASGAVEAPRGILFHQYEFDDDGVCLGANMCIPTNQNHANIQRDMEEFVPGIIKESEDDIRLKLEMLVRAYDPCISCSTHMLNVKFV